MKIAVVAGLFAKWNMNVDTCQTSLFSIFGLIFISNISFKACNKEKVIQFSKSLQRGWY